MEEESQVSSDDLNLQEVIAKGSLDFDSWTSLISEVEKTYPDDIEQISLVYDSFLSEFPLCYGYWRKYASHKAHLCTIDKAIKVFEQAVQSATFSVGVWVEYCSFSMLVFEDPFDVRRLFNRGLSFVGKDYLCHSLWDKYIEFEFSQKHWSSLAHIYIQTLKFPTKKLHHYYDSFKKLAAIWEEEMECPSNSAAKVQRETVFDCEVATCCKDDEILSVIKDLLDPSDGLFRHKVLQKYVSIGEQLYQRACELDEKIHGFEMHIRRPYFHVKPLDVCQLENWHHYLDFVEMQGDFDWAVKLYERCLIACANFPEFWMRYVEFMETKGGREIANFAVDRATKVFLKRVPAIHHFNARYKELIGDTFGARAAFLNCDADSDSICVEKLVKQANMEKRLGNLVAAANIYNEALEMAAKKKKLHTLPIIYVQFSRLKYMITGSADAARDVLIDGIKHIPCSKLLLKELINFVMLHGGSTDMSVVGSIIYNAISQGTDESQGFSSRDGEDISNLYLELVDFCGTIHDVRKAWIRHRKLFPHSIRTASSSTQSANYTNFLKNAIEKRQEIPASMPHNLLGSNTSDHLSQLPMTNQELSLPENHHFQTDQAATDHIQSRISDDNATERLQHECHIVLERSTEDVPELKNSTIGTLEEVAHEIKFTNAFREYSEANDMQEDHDHRFEQELKPISLESLSLNSQNNDSPDSIPTIAHECEGPQETCMFTESTERSRDIDVNPSISSPTGAQAADSAQLFSVGMLESGKSMNGSPSISSQTGTQAAADSAQMKDGSMLQGASVSSPLGTPGDSSTILVKPLGPSSSESNEESILPPTLPELQMLANSDECQLQINNLDNPDSKSGSCRQPQDKQHQQVSQQQQYQKTEMDTQDNACQSMSQESVRDQQDIQARYQYEDAITQGNLSATHAWAPQTVQQQGFASPSQSQLPAQLVAYPQEQMFQYPIPSNVQSGNMQSSQAYYQMWQYYYYQQQQQQQFLQQQQYYHHQQQLQPQHVQEQLPQQQYHQQQSQMQQHYLQQQEQQPPYHQHNQFVQQQYHQQQLQSQQPFSQQQLQQPPPYQAQQIQQQQHLLYMQQLQNQQYSQSQEQQQQPQHHQLPHPQILQQLLQQQQWKKQQQQENHQTQQQQEQGHQQQQQQATPSQIQTWNSSYQEVQVLTPPQGTPSGQAVSPHPQELSTQNQ